MFTDHVVFYLPLRPRRNFAVLHDLGWRLFRTVDREALQIVRVDGYTIVSDEGPDSWIKVANPVLTDTQDMPFRQAS
jgi:hypothetical protein